MERVLTAGTSSWKLQLQRKVPFYSSIMKINDRCGDHYLKHHMFCWVNRGWRVVLAGGGCGWGAAFHQPLLLHPMRHKKMIQNDRCSMFWGWKDEERCWSHAEEVNGWCACYQTPDWHHLLCNHKIVLNKSNQCFFCHFLSVLSSRVENCLAQTPRYIPASVSPRDDYFVYWSSSLSFDSPGLIKFSGRLLLSQ